MLLRFYLWLYKKLKVKLNILEATTKEAAEDAVKIAEKQVKNFRRVEVLELANALHRRYIKKLLKDPERIKQLISLADPGTCKHRKGGKFSPDGHYSDYAITCHRLPDGRLMVRCMVCGRRWKPKDVDWVLAQDMIAKSSNHMSTSEIVFLNPEEIISLSNYKPISQAEPLVVCHDPLFAEKEVERNSEEESIRWEM